MTAGDYSQTFGLVDEGVTWFSDAANGGGPADNFLRLHLVVTDAPQDQADGGTVADMSDGDGGDPGAPGVGGNGDTGDTGDGTPPATPAKHGCSFAPSGAPAGWLPLLFVAALLVRRRRAA